MEDTVTNEIERLAALQEMDRRAKEKRELLAALTRDIDERKEGIARQRSELESLQVEHAALEAQRVELDAKLGVEETRIKDSRMRLNRIRNERELMAMRREIDLAKEANKQLEEQLIAIMEQLEALGTRATEAKETLAGLEADAERQLAEWRERSAGLQQEIDLIGTERTVVAQGLTSSLRAKYEQIFARRGGTAVVEVRNGTCQGCHMNVPPQLFNELQKHRDVRLCPNCHRILFWRPEPQDQSVSR